MRFVVAAACFFSLASVSTAGRCATSAPAAPSLSALLANARASSGSPYLYHVVSRSRETLEGRTYDITTETEGLKYRARRCFKEICSGFYFDGERSFNANFNDTALPIANGVDGLQLTLRAISSYAFTAPDFRAKGGQILERGNVLRAGKTYRRIAVAPRFGALLDAVLDAQSGLVVGVISDERRLAFEFRDERKVADKLQLPYVIALNGNVVESFDDRRISSEPLAAPTGIVPRFAGNPTVAMRALDHATILPTVPCTLGGVAVVCLFDTGNSGLSISLELSEKLKLEPRSAAFGVSGIGQYMTGIVRAPSLLVGPATYPAADYVVLHDLHAYGYDVVLGADAFAHARIAIDYAKRAVSLVASAPRTGVANLTFENFVPVAPIAISGTTLQLAVDTGNEGAIDIRSDVYAQHPTLFKPSGKIGVSGIGGSSNIVVGDVPTAQFMNFDIKNVRIGASEKSIATAMGHVGSALLSHFTATFDYANERLELEPRTGDAAVSASAPESR